MNFAKPVFYISITLFFFTFPELTHTQQDVYIRVNKSQYKLSLMSDDNTVISTYPVSIGLNPDLKPKRYQGDNRTPEGTYRITEIMTRDMPVKSQEYKKLATLNKRNYLAKNGYHKYGQPGVDLGTNAYGYAYIGINYPNKTDLRSYETACIAGQVPKKAGKYVGPGSGIAIHGNNDPASIQHPASQGCVRMLNTDIKQLVKNIKTGTKVVILP
ncbi:MAG: L,D-transpeptidase [Elusimicrobiota bacterium]